MAKKRTRQAPRRRRVSEAQLRRQAFRLGQVRRNATAEEVAMAILDIETFGPTLIGIDVLMDLSARLAKLVLATVD